MESSIGVMRSTSGTADGSGASHGQAQAAFDFCLLF
jgi:hypothetical protein